MQIQVRNKGPLVCLFFFVLRVSLEYKDLFSLSLSRSLSLSLSRSLALSLSLSCLSCCVAHADCELVMAFCDRWGHVVYAVPFQSRLLQTMDSPGQLRVDRQQQQLHVVVLVWGDDLLKDTGPPFFGVAQRVNSFWATTLPLPRTRSTP